MVGRFGAGVLVTTAVVGLALTGCSSMERAAATQEPTSYAGPPTGATAPSSSAPASSASGSPSAGGSSATPAGTSTGGKVSASTASEEELFAALSKAGVPTPSRWAQEVIEYRPYPANDPTLGKLRQNLAKANPPPGVTDKIVSALTP